MPCVSLLHRRQILIPQFILLLDAGDLGVEPNDLVTVLVAQIMSMLLL